MAKIALFGDSYISRLERYCEGVLKVPGEIKFFGKGGMRVDQLYCGSRFRTYLDGLISFGPDIVFICIGGNDIEVDTAPADIARGIEELIETLRKSGVKTILVHEIGTRGHLRGGLTKEIFDSKRKSINKKLKQIPMASLIRFPKITYPSGFSDDLVHYNQRGMQHFYHGVRRVLLSMKI